MTKGPCILVSALLLVSGLHQQSARAKLRG
jgi:hypothetical protein